MSKGIIAAIILIVALIGWRVFQYWLDISAEERGASRPEIVAALNLDPRSLAGMPPAARDTLENSLTKAQTQGAPALREWLNACRKLVADPRLGWIELDYIVLLARDNPAEAKRIFAEVKDRTPPTSPIYPRLKQLEKTYQ
ncbi:MAG: hypothetical protein RL380_1558 [Verrucomicrobiota bacterium]|jgi:hypothetical protein